MSQKKRLSDKINSLDIFSKAVELEPIDYKETKISKDIISCGALTKKNDKKITDYMKQAKEMLIKKQTQSSYYYINKDNTKTTDKRLIEEKNKNIPKSKKNISIENIAKKLSKKNIPKSKKNLSIEIIDKKVSKKEELNKFEKRINESDYISSKNNLENSNILGRPYNLIQLGGGPKQLEQASIQNYINLQTLLPRKDLIKWAKEGNCAIFIYKIDSSYSLDLIPVVGIRAGTGAIFQNYKLTEYGKDYITKNGTDIYRSAPFNTLYYEHDSTTDNQFMIKLGTDGLLINMKSNSYNYNRTIVQNMLTDTTVGIISPGDILFFNKMSDAEETGLKTNEALLYQQPPVHPSKFIQLRDNSRTETILNLRTEIMPICYTERHFEYMNNISRDLPDTSYILRLTYLYDKYSKIKKNIFSLRPQPESSLTLTTKLLDRVTQVDDQLKILTAHLKTTVTVGNYGALYNKICSATAGSTPNYLEIDDGGYDAEDNDPDPRNGPPRYCQNLDEKNKPPYPPHTTRDTRNQDCMRNKTPWTGDDGLQYTVNCSSELPEQYVWAMKEMSMISSRCPKSVNDDTDQTLYASDILDHMLANSSYDLGQDPQTSPNKLLTAQFLRRIGTAGAFVHNSNYNDATINKYRTLYRSASFKMFEKLDESVVCNSYTSTSTNVGNTIRAQFLPTDGYFYVLKLAKDVPYIPISGENPHSARTCYPNEEEILLPPGCRFTLKNIHRGITLRGPRGPPRINITIYAVYIEYINAMDHIDECNNYISERSPFTLCHREPPVENLFKNEIRIPNDLLEPDILKGTFKDIRGDENLKSEPPLDGTPAASPISLSSKLTQFWNDIYPI